MEKESFYQKSLKEDINIVNSKYNSKLANFTRDLSMIIGTIELLISVLVGLGIALSGNIAFGFIFAIVMQLSTLGIINNLENARNDNIRKFGLSKYCASERIEELSERLKDESIDVSYDAIKHAEVTTRKYGQWSPIESNMVEENRLLVKSDSTGYQVIEQRIENLKYLREHATIYQLKCIERNEEGKIKRKSM